MLATLQIDCMHLETEIGNSENSVNLFRCFHSEMQISSSTFYSQSPASFIHCYNSTIMYIHAFFTIRLRHCSINHFAEVLHLEGIADVSDCTMSDVSSVGILVHSGKCRLSNTTLTACEMHEEINTYGISSLDLVKKLRESGKTVEYISDFDNITNFLKENVKPLDIVLTLGAGTVTKIGPMLIK